MHPRSREIRLRNTAKRQGFVLVKSRRRDPRAIGYGRFCLVDRWNATRVVAAMPGGFGLVDAPTERGGKERWAAWVTLDAIERWLTDGMQKPAEAGRFLGQAVASGTPA